MVLGNETSFHHILCFTKSVEGLPAPLGKAYFNWQSRKEGSSWKTREDSVTPFLCMRTETKSRPSLICATERKRKRVALQVPCRTVIPKISSKELNNCKTPFWTQHSKMFLISSVSFLEQTQGLPPLQPRTWDPVHVRSTYLARCIKWTLDMIQMAY